MYHAGAGVDFMEHSTVDLEFDRGTNCAAVRWGVVAVVWSCLPARKSLPWSLLSLSL